MSIRCGHCKDRHDTVADVKACNRPAVPVVVALVRTPPGIYAVGQDVYRLDGDGQWRMLFPDGTWIRMFRPERPRRMTVEEVAAIGRIMVRCLVCGRKLTRKESREAGIGPVCAGKV